MQDTVTPNYCILLEVSSVLLHSLAWAVVWNGSVQGDLVTEVGIVAVLLSQQFCIILFFGGQGGRKAPLTSTSKAFDQTQ